MPWLPERLIFLEALTHIPSVIHLFVHSFLLLALLCTTPCSSLSMSPSLLFNPFPIPTSPPMRCTLNMHMQTRWTKKINKRRSRRRRREKVGGGGEITFGGELNNEQLCGVLCGFGGRGSEPLTQNLCRYVSVLLDGRNKGAQTHPMASSEYADSRLAGKPNLFS